MLQRNTIPSTPRPVAVNGVWRLVVVAWVVSFAILLFDLADGTLYLGDTDDVLRALQIRELLRSGNWFDRTLPFISMPEPYVSPWSRLVDLPYLVVAKGLALVVGDEAGLKAAFLIWPPVMLAGYCLLVVSIIKEMLPEGKVLGTPVLVVTVLAMALSIWEFSPGRIDHHNVQLLAILFIFWGLIRWTYRSAVVAAVAVVVSMAVGLELLPLVAVVLATISGSWILRRSGIEKFYAGFGFAILICAPLAGLLLIGFRGLTATECDAFSAPYIAGLMAYGVLTILTAALLAQSGPRVRSFALLFAAFAFLVLLAFSFPLCLSGPYHMVDPLSRALWLERLAQEHSILIYFQKGYFPHLLTLAVLMAVLVLASPVIRSTWQSGKSGTPIVFAVAVGSLILACLQTRYIRFPMALIPLFIPVALAAINDRPRFAVQLLAGSVAILAALGWTLHLAIPVKPGKVALADFLSYAACKDADMSAIKQLAPGRVMAPMAVGLDLVTHLPPGVTIAGIPFHRSSPGMRRIFETFVQVDPHDRRQAAAPFDYVALCRFEAPEEFADALPLAALSRGGDWPGLIRLTEPKRQLQVFKIDHTRFQ
ncbi:hypothetical protein [Rhizobium glycinendophyticum]|uniref:Glycosyltransferase RgtA/B/C/D-like domain-containing protein n=1 Tax=Rhizobium glycinendophyticum TaxID=2589807 RepID=A0A504U8H9_9HYPH|nr:hypothetical protein [Rhizobium glycinendophyticum]TPP11488.1 hypothetical protein FJQ55_11985 [Rhizobium glycinendophyticum]